MRYSGDNEGDPAVLALSPSAVLQDSGETGDDSLWKIESTGWLDISQHSWKMRLVKGQGDHWLKRFWLPLVGLRLGQAWRKPSALSLRADVEGEIIGARTDCDNGAGRSVAKTSENIGGGVARISAVSGSSSASNTWTRTVVWSYGIRLNPIAWCLSRQF